MYTSYIDLLSAVNFDGEKTSPSNVTANRSFMTKELQNVQLKLSCDNFTPFMLNDDEVKYAEYELNWFLGNIVPPKRPVNDLGHELKTNSNVAIETWVDPHKKVRQMAESLIGCINRDGPNSNYGEMCLRLKNHIGVTQKEWIVKKLQQDPGSRQAVAFYNHPGYQYWSNDDFVCTLNQLFTIKDNKLNTTVNIRSNDLVKCFRFDVLWYHLFAKIICAELRETYPELTLGTMFFNIMSAHIYLKDEATLFQIIEASRNGTFKTLNGEFA